MKRITRRKIATAVVAGALLGGVGFVDAAGAAQPAIQGCVGDFFNLDAPENGGPVPGVGATVSVLAKNKTFGTFGNAIQFIQTGVVDADTFPNPCYTG
jgi:hypothetical protein